jgi:hypothetical protein
VSVVLTDVLERRGRTHRHRSGQLLSFAADGRIARILHEDLPGARESLQAFRDATSGDGPAKA